VRAPLPVIGLTALVMAALPAPAEQGDTEVGFRLLGLSASATADGEIAGTGGTPELSSNIGTDVSWLLWPLDRLAVELSLGVSAHPLEASGGELAGVDGGTLWRLPVSAVAQYRFALFGPFHPYVGLGLSYNVTKLRSSSAYDERFSEVGFSDDVGVVVQAGLDYALDERWSANLDLRFMAMRTDAVFTDAGSGATSDVGFPLDPWVVGLGFRYRY
jgi:outer membrane protein